jgi:hypothetical protein
VRGAADGGMRAAPKPYIAGLFEFKIFRRNL